MKNNKNRATQQASENLKDVRMDAPSERFQQDQQVGSVVDAGKTATPESSFIVKGVDPSKKATLKTEVAAEVVSGRNSAGGSASDLITAEVMGLRNFEFSGDSGTVLGSAAETPVHGKDTQGGSRFEKRISDANKNINYNASEQVYIPYEQIPPLAESDSTVGYNGTPKSVAAKSQKNSGLTPAEYLYNRSLDFVTQDMAVFSAGQRVYQSGVESAVYPTKEWKRDENGSWTSTSITSAKAPKSGNFMPLGIKVKLKRAKKGERAFVSSFEIEEADLSITETNSRVVNVSSANAQIDLNASELTRQRIDAKAGAPTDLHFNPLGRSIMETSQMVHYLRDIESTTGAEVFAAYKFAQKARGHYLQRTAKDGQNLVTPAIDALYGGLGAYEDINAVMTANDLSDTEGQFFSKTGMKNGSAAVMISLFDSPRKYKTKADIITQPRGLRMHLQTADNNMDPFHCKKEFVAALNSVDAYSTIDHGYDPTAPVFITDNVRLIHPYSWSRMLKFTRTAANLPRNYAEGSALVSYKYAAGSGANQYIIRVADPLLNGIAYFMELHADGLYDAMHADGDGDEITWYVPIVHSTTHFALWDYLVCASLPYVIYERTNTMKDVLDYETFVEYPFVEFTSIKSANPMNAVNYSNPSVMEPLIPGQMQASSAIRWKFPELLYPLGSGYFMLPWYMSDRDMEFTSTGVANFGECSHFSTPAVREGIVLEGLRAFFDMDVRDQLYNLDVMTVKPGNRTGVSAMSYKYSLDTDGIPCVKDAITVKQWMSTPRQLGWFMSMPLGALYGGSDLSLKGVAVDTAVSVLGPSFCAVTYQGGSVNPSSTTTILDDASVMVNRAQAFAQRWKRRYAYSKPTKWTNDTLMLGPGDAFTFIDDTSANPQAVSKENITTFMPFLVKGDFDSDNRVIDQGSGSDAYPSLFSIMRAYWAQIQKTPFVLNPFGCAHNAASEGGVDPFDLALLFGLCGWLAADYHEDQYNRIVERMNLGYGFIRDPFVSASPVFRDAFKYTEIG